MSEKENELAALEVIAKGQQDLFALKKAATHRFEMIIYPAIVGMFIMAGIFVGVLFTMIDNIDKRVAQNYASCQKPNISKTQTSHTEPLKRTRLDNAL